VSWSLAIQLLLHITCCRISSALFIFWGFGKRAESFRVGGMCGLSRAEIVSLLVYMSNLLLRRRALQTFWTLTGHRDYPLCAVTKLVLTRSQLSQHLTRKSQPSKCAPHSIVRPQPLCPLTPGQACQRRVYACKCSVRPSFGTGSLTKPAGCCSRRSTLTARPSVTWFYSTERPPGGICWIQKKRN